MKILLRENITTRLMESQLRRTCLPLNSTLASISMNIPLRVFLSFVILPIPLYFGFFSMLAILGPVSDVFNEGVFGLRQVKHFLIFAGGPLGVIGLIRGLVGKNDLLNMYFLIHGSFSYIHLTQNFFKQAIVTPSVNESIMFVFAAAPIFSAIYWVIKIGTNKIKKC